MRRAILLVMLGACGFPGNAAPTDGDPTADAPDPLDAPPMIDGDPVPIDAPPIDAAPPSCTDRWIAGPAFSTPVEVGGVNGSGAEADPWLTGDELTMYFVRSSNVYVATRQAVTDGFGTPAIEAGLSSSSNDSKASLTQDGLTAFVNSSRSGGEGNGDVWRVTRPSTSAPFNMSDQTYLAMVNDGGEQWDPHISGDGLRLYLAPSGGIQHIAVATRPNDTTAFGSPVIIAELQSAVVDNDPTLSLDERIVVFASSRDGPRQLYYAIRNTTTGLFNPPVVVPAPVNATGSVVDDGPHLSADGCQLYFTSNRGSGGDDDLWVATVQ